MPFAFKQQSLLTHDWLYFFSKLGQNFASVSDVLARFRWTNENANFAEHGHVGTHFKGNDNFSIRQQYFANKRDKGHIWGHLNFYCYISFFMQFTAYWNFLSFQQQEHSTNASTRFCQYWHHAFISDVGSAYTRNCTYSLETRFEVFFVVFYATYYCKYNSLNQENAAPYSVITELNISLSCSPRHLYKINGSRRIRDESWYLRMRLYRVTDRNRDHVKTVIAAFLMISVTDQCKFCSEYWLLFARWGLLNALCVLRWKWWPLPFRGLNPHFLRSCLPSWIAGLTHGLLRFFLLWIRTVHYFPQFLYVLPENRSRRVDRGRHAGHVAAFFNWQRLIHAP